MSTKRHQARQDAFCLLFEKTFTDEDIDQIIEGATQTRDLQVDRFTLDLAKGTVEHMQEIDALIEPKLKNWKLSRLSRVSLSVLRMAVYELKYLTDIPAGVTINEAVELNQTVCQRQMSTLCQRCTRRCCQRFGPHRIGSAKNRIIKTG